MFPIDLGQLAKVIGGKLVRGNPTTPVGHAVYMSTDYIEPHKVFFLRTRYMEKFSPNVLRTKKCAGVIATSAYQNEVPVKHALILVPDTTIALWKLAIWQRAKSKALVIGVTGSQGKTTTKEMIASILKRKYNTYKSASNHNLAAFTPGHMVSLNPQHQVAVLEMGMASFHNIQRQCAYSKPKIGVVTNVGEAHVGKLGHSLENVAKAKQELIDGLHPNGTLVINADDVGSKRLVVSRFRGKVIRISIKNPADLKATEVIFTENGMSFKVGNVPYRIKSLGEHNVYNALAAIAVAQTLNVPTESIQEGLVNYTPPAMRLQKLPGINGYLLINDAYNANPSSMIAGLKVLKQLAKNRKSVAILGDILELGQYSAKGHARVGNFIAANPPDYLITIGSDAQIIARTAAKGMPTSRIRSFATREQAYRFIKSSIPAGAVLYFKASRKMALEKLVKQLRKGTFSSAKNGV